jgi:hypothetical protein
MTALESSDRYRPLRKQINDLTLALVTPLGADDDDETAVGHAN